MYGMVNKAIEQMVRRHFGDTAWGAVKRRAGATQEVFVSTEIYPDELTVRLIAATAECTGTRVTEVLQRFTEYWVLDAPGSEYGHLFGIAGRSLGQYLANLPQLHDRIALQFPALQPPRLLVTERTERSLRLHYFGRRPGLNALMKGFIRGAAKRFATPVRLTREPSVGPRADCNILRVEW